MRSRPSGRCVIRRTVWPSGRVEHVVHQALGRLGVEVRGRLVEQEHWGAGEQRARQHEALARPPDMRVPSSPTSVSRPAGSEAIQR